MISITIDIPDEMAMELNAHIARFKNKLHIDVRVNEMVLSAINGYLIEHCNDIEDYRAAHEPIKYCTHKRHEIPCEQPCIACDVECH